MSETTPTLDAATSSAVSSKRSRWVWLGPLLGVVAVIAGWVGWEAWKNYRFEKERTETPPHVVADLKLKLLWIPAGTFVMGTEDEAGWLKSLKEKYNDVKPDGWARWGEWYEKGVLPNDSPATTVTLTKGFYLGETEVTQSQWEAVMGSNPSRYKGPNQPVEGIGRFYCLIFCKKLTERERAAGRLGAKHEFRLPTEAEWEYACRAGSRGGWCFGDDVNRLGEYAWYEANSGNQTHEVGAKRANAWGFYDMHGNVWEWCVDWYGSYPGGRVSDPTGALTGDGVVRSASWNYPAGNCRSASRQNGVKLHYYGEKFTGFRIALSPAR